MSYNQIKNQVVSPAKRTASAANKVLAKLPDIHPVAGISLQIVKAVLMYPLADALKNPRKYLIAAAPVVAATAASAFLGGPAGLAVVLAAGAGIVVSFAVIAAVIFCLLAVITLYEQRVAMSKAVVELLHAI